MPTPSVTNAMKPWAAARRSAGRLGVDVDLAGDEEEVVADAVQQDAGVEHPHQRAVVAEREQHVARRPRRHADEQHVLHAEPAEEPRHHQHEADLRHLAERHLAGGVRHADLVQEGVGERVVELQRDADEERAEHEDRRTSDRRSSFSASRPSTSRERRPVRRASAAACAAARARRGRAATDAGGGDAHRHARWPRGRACRWSGRRRSSRSCRARGRRGNSRPGRVIWRNDSELLSASVGM